MDINLGNDESMYDCNVRKHLKNIHLPTTTLSHQDVASNMIRAIEDEQAPQVKEKQILSEKKAAKENKINELKDEIKKKKEEFDQKKKNLENELKIIEKGLEGWSPNVY